MPQIGWLEILIIVSIAIIVVGPKDFPIMLKKVGSWIGSVKKYVSNVQNEVSTLQDETKNIYEDNEKKSENNNDKGKKKMSEKEIGFISHLTELRQRLINSLNFFSNSICYYVTFFQIIFMVF